MTECEYKITVEAGREYNLGVDEEIQVMFPSDDFQFLVRVDIPPNL